MEKSKKRTPAKSVRSDKWFVRIDGAEKYLRQKCEELVKCIDVKRFAAAYHTGKTQKENPHVHFVIECSESQKQSFAVRLKGLFDIATRNDYAVDVWDGITTEGAVGYLFHEDTEVFCVKAISLEDLEKAKESDRKIRDIIEKNKEKASHKLIDLALEEFSSQPYTGKRDILMFMLVKCREGICYYPGSYLLKKYVEEVELKIVHDDHFETYVDEMAKSLWR